VTITTLRPNAQAFLSHAITFGGGATTTYGATNDNSDTTYIQGQVDKMYCRLAFGTTTIAAGTRVKSAQLRIRNASGGGGGTTQDTLTGITTNTISHFGLSAPVGQYLSTRGLTSILTGTGPIAYAAPGGRTWSQAIIDDICLITFWYKAHYGSIAVFQRVHELYIDLDINSQPTISGAPVVTNFTNNATPTVTWTYFDADDDLQATWRVKIFDAATIAAGNFNADTSKATWDSLQQYGNDGQTTVPIALLNSVSYTAYVNVAQAWPGPEGQYWWSGWSASSPFTITFTPPPTPVIQSAAVLTDFNQYRAVLQIQAPDNLLSADNSSFEGGLGNWTALTNCTITQSATFAADGTQSMRMSSTAGGDMVAKMAIDVNKQPQVQGGQAYTIVAQFRAGASARTVNVGVAWLDNAGVQIGATLFGGNVTDATANFNTQAQLVSTVAPAGAYQAELRTKVQATGAGAELHYVDKVQIIVGSSTTWISGSYTNDQGDLILERGEYIIDDRGPADNWFHPQVATCGTMFRTHEYGFSGNPASSSDTLNWRWLNKAIPSEGDTPDGMLDFYPGTTSVPYLRFGEWAIAASTAFMVPVVQGQVHGFWVWGWTDTGTVNVTPTIDWRDITGTIVSSTSGSLIAMTTTPQRFFVSGTPPGTAFYGTGAIVGPVTAVAGSHWLFTRAGFGLGTIPVDGKQPRGVPTGLLATGQPAGIVWTNVRWRDDGESMGSQVKTNFPPGRYSAQQEIFADYEYPPARPVIYRASITQSTTGNTVKSNYAYVVVYGAPPTQSLLRSTTNPLLQVAINRRKEASFQFPDDQTTFHPLGADAAPILVRDWYSGEDAQSIVVVVSNPAQSQRLRSVIRAADVLEIQWAQGGRTYMLITDRQVAETLTSDVDLCDADGVILPYMKYEAITLGYIETVAP
jgi:hypothetical protein